MGTRMVRGDLLDSDRYWGVGIEARQLFVHLLLLADDYGCLAVAPTFLRRRAFNDMPTDQKIAKLLNELQDADLIRLYDHNRACYAFIPRFRQKLQRATLKHPVPPASHYQDDEDAQERFELQRRVESGEAVLHFGKAWQDIKAQAFERDGHACIRCGSSEKLAGHHLVPKSRGGETTLQNVVTLCGSCNSWARNNEQRCNEIKELFAKAVSGQMLDRCLSDAAQPPKRREEKRREEIQGSAFQPPAKVAQVWPDFEEHRKKLKKPMTDRARSLIVAKLDSLEKQGHDPIAVLEQSIRQGWQDVFPLRGDSKVTTDGKPRLAI